MNCASCGHDIKAHMHGGAGVLCSVQKCMCQQFNYPSTVSWYKVIDVDGDKIELWDGKTRARYGSGRTEMVTMTIVVSDHDFQKGDEVVLSIQYVRRGGTQ